MKFLKKTAAFFAIFFSAMLVGSWFISSHWKVERSVVIQASPEKIYPLIANFKTGWKQWSGLDFEDPKTQYVMTQSDPQKGIEFEMRMAENDFVLYGRLSFENVPNGTRVTWMDTGEVGAHPIYRWLSLFMDKAMGATFEKSLNELKRIAEAA